MIFHLHTFTQYWLGKGTLYNYAKLVVLGGGGGGRLDGQPTARL
jgi:hypothetical protein